MLNLYYIYLQLFWIPKAYACAVVPGLICFLSPRMKTKSIRRIKRDYSRIHTSTTRLLTRLFFFFFGLFKIYIMNTHTL